MGADDIVTHGEERLLMVPVASGDGSIEDDLYLLLLVLVSLLFLLGPSLVIDLGSCWLAAYTAMFTLRCLACLH